MKTHFMWFALMLCTAFMSTAQNCTYTLEGIVKDFHDDSKLALAQVYVEPLQKTVTTDDKGYFKINDLCAGTYTIRVSHIDCEPKVVILEINNSMKIEVLLEHHVEDLQAVKVIADVHDDHNSSQSATRINQVTINNYSGATLGDALASVPGVSALKTGNSVVKPIVHGLYGSRVAIVNDGMRQQDQEWGIEHAPNIDVNTASSIQVVKGATALRYGGDAVGGTIVIKPSRVISKDTLNGTLISQLQSNGRGGSITASVNNYRKSGWYEQSTVTYKKLGDFEAPDYVLSNTGSETAAVNLGLGYKKFEYGAHLKYSFYNSTLGILRASHVGNTADLVTSINSGVPTVIDDFTYDIDAPRQEVNHHSIQLGAFKRFAALGKLEFDYSFQFNNRKEYDIRRGANAGRASLDIDLQTHIAAANLLIDRYDKATFNIGIDSMYQVNTPNPDTGVRRLIPDYNAFKAGLYASVTHEFKDNWLIDAGMRYDRYHIDAQKFYRQSRWDALGYDEQFPQFEVEPRGTQLLTNPVLDYDLFAFTIGSKYFFNDHYDLAINLSTANRAPNPSELFSEGLHHALATIEIGRLDLNKEQSYKLNTTFHVQKGKLDVEVNPYFNLVTDFVQLAPTGIETTTRGDFVVYQYEQLDARLYGVDVSASYDFWAKKPLPQVDQLDMDYSMKKLFNLSSNFSYIHGTNTSDDQPLIDMPPAQFNNTFTWFDAFNSGLDVRVSNQTVFQQTRFPDNDFSVDVPLDSGGFEEATVRISQTPAAYSLWNAGMSYAFAKAELNLSINNLLNTNYRNALNRQRFYADDVGRDIQIQFIYHI